MPKTAPKDTPLLAPLDAALARLDAAPLLHKGEAASVALGALREVLVALDGRLTRIEAALAPLTKL